MMAVTLIHLVYSQRFSTFNKQWLSVGLLLLLLDIKVQGQVNQMDWYYSAGGSGWDEISTVAINSDKDFISLGYIGDTVQFNSNSSASSGTVVLPSSSINYEAFIKKVDSLGHLDWVYPYGATGFLSPWLKAIAIDSNDNIIVAGSYRDSVDFDFSSTGYYLPTTGFDNGFVQKLNSNGSLLWAASIGSENQLGDEIVDIKVDDSLNVYAVGFFQGIVDFDPGSGIYQLNSANGGNQFILKLDANGNFIWAKNFGGSNSAVTSFHIAPNGDFWLAGRFWGTKDFDPGPAVFNLVSAPWLNGNSVIPDAYVLGLDPRANFKWAKKISGTGSPSINKIKLDNQNRVCVVGSFNDSIDFDPGMASQLRISSGVDAFFLKLDSIGDFHSLNTFGHQGNAFISDFFYDGDDNLNLLVIGKGGNGIDLDPNSPNTLYGVPSTSIYNQSHLVNWSGNGTFNGAQTLDSTLCTTLLRLGSEKLALAGRLEDSISLDISGNANVVTPFNGGWADLFLAKYSFCSPKRAVDSIISCGPYTWIDGVTYTNNNNSARDTLLSNSGCDSIVELFLEVYQPSASSQVLIACDSLTWMDGITYTYSNNIAKDTLLNRFGCDSVISLDLTILESFSVIDSVSACNQFRWIDSVVYTSSGLLASDTLVAQNGCDSIIFLNLNLIYDQLINSEPVDTSLGLGQTAVFNLTADSSSSFQWQSDLGFGFQNLSDAGQYAGTSTNELTIRQVTISNDNQLFRCIVNGQNCADTSDAAKLNIISNITSEKYQITRFQFYPNPSSGQLNVHTSNISIGNVSVINNLGKVLYEMPFNQSEFSLNLEGLAAGLYFIELSYSGKKVRRPFVIQ